MKGYSIMTNIDQIIRENLPAIIGGCFSILGALIKNSTNDANSGTGIILERRSSLGTVLIDVGLIYILVLIGNIIVIINANEYKPFIDAAEIPSKSIEITATIFMIIGFTISAARTRPRWVHIFFVSIILWLVTYIAVMQKTLSMDQFIAAGPGMLILMTVGGILSYFFSRT